MSEPVAPCPTCPEGWRPLDKEHCPDCYEGRIERLKIRIEALEAALREIKDQYLFPNQSSAIARAALDKDMTHDLRQTLLF